MSLKQADPKKGFLSGGKPFSQTHWSFTDWGDDDFLFEGNSMVHVALKKRGIPHEYRVRDGSHNWTYWRSSLPKVLAFISDYFHQK